jgi:hypothetical protein
MGLMPLQKRLRELVCPFIFSKKIPFLKQSESSPDNLLVPDIGLPSIQNCEQYISVVCKLLKDN